MKIGEIAEQLDIPTSTIRYYEKIGLIPAVMRESGQRHYTEEILPFLKFIQLAKAVGFTLEEIQELIVVNGRKQWRTIAQERVKKLDAAINQTVMMRDALQSAIDCNRCIGQIFEFLNDTELEVI